MKDVFKISNLQELCENYDAFILDQWGVMHDGYEGYPDAIRCINYLFEK